MKDQITVSIAVIVELTHEAEAKGDPVTVDPFIGAEKQSGHSVKRACELLEVSRAAFCTRRTDAPGPGAVREAELTEKATKVHASRGNYGAPRIHAVLQHEGERCGRRRIARLMRQRGLPGRHRRRRQRTTIPDPRAAARSNLVLRDFQPDPAALDAAGAATSPTSRPRRAGFTWPPSSMSPRGVWWAGPPPTTCAPNWSPTPCGRPAAPAARPPR